MPRRAGADRAQVLIESADRPTLQAFLPGWLDALRALPDERRLRWSIDVDPVDLY
jgi:primosomal protein N' (replication factor Y)